VKEAALPAVPDQPSVPLGRSLVVLALAGLTVAACLIGTPPAGKSETAIRMDLPGSVGMFLGTEQKVSESERVILPSDTEFAKKLYSNGRGLDINCQIVLAGSEKRSIHRPEICLPGQGWTVKSGQVVPVSLANGKKLDVMKLVIARPVTLNNGQQKELTSLFLYWFVGKDTTTPHHMVRVLRTNLDMLLHNTNHRWAYVIVSSPVLDGFTPGGQNEQQTLDSLKGFISDLAPKIMKAPEAQAAAPPTPP
jgi:hypothetical protein